MKMMNMSAVAASLLLAAGMTGYGAPAPAVEPTGWKFEITPYAWLAGLEGDVKVHGHKVDFDKSFSDLLDATEFGGSLLGVVMYDRFVFWGQLDYFSLSTDALDVEDQPQGGSLDSKMLLTEGAVGYQVDGWMEGQTFDLMIGVRNMHIENDLTIYGVGDRSNTRDITDPMFVCRPSMRVFPSKIDGLRFNPTLAIGGGGDSDLVYELAPQFEYAFNENVCARLGYRTVGYKFKGDNNSDNELNVNLAGLIAGVGFKF